MKTVKDSVKAIDVAIQKGIKKRKQRDEHMRKRYKSLRMMAESAEGEAKRKRYIKQAIEVLLQGMKESHEMTTSIITLVTKRMKMHRADRE